MQTNIEKLFQEKPETEPSYANPEVRAAMDADGVPPMIVDDVVTGLAMAIDLYVRNGLLSPRDAAQFAAQAGTFSHAAAIGRVTSKGQAANG